MAAAGVTSGKPIDSLEAMQGTQLPESENSHHSTDPSSARDPKSFSDFGLLTLNNLLILAICERLCVVSTSVMNGSIFQRVSLRVTTPRK